MEGFWAALPDEQRIELLKDARAMSFGQGARLAKAGAPVETVYVLTDGFLALHVTYAGRKSPTIGLKGP